ncbi:Lactonase, 7-bladed beta-propeller-domain-containing protein [Aspergillus avenaceus]|uniref:Lactonase, 7-bladed beta-propeller-domain-containing protein n=1 Tax=Aspergillus avenaceus TaxID=36643 RepID=A0A5N6TNF9_ASPAV|nr:Lactonase, 7-bladed beta-propeller-domain-containing protein [Aspergillus avenaceus]
MRVISLTAALYGTGSMASTLYAATYAGTVATLGLESSDAGYQLTTTSETKDCGPNPSWLMPDPENGVLYCLDEAFNGPNGTVTSFQVGDNGVLTKLHQLQTLIGPVHSLPYTAADRTFFVTAHYSGSAVTTYVLESKLGAFSRHQTFTYELSGPGAVPDRQEAPHPHGVVIDPTGQFVLIPDLGADLVRVYAINPSTGSLESREPLQTSPGSGPRHGVFWTPEGTDTDSTEAVRFYLVSELNSHLTGYNVEYGPNRTLSFTKFYEASTFGESEAPSGGTAAEIAISPSNTHIVITNRNDTLHFAPGNDSIAVFNCANEDGDRGTEVAFSDIYPAYGFIPRHFEIAPTGDHIALALQNSESLAVAGWEEATGASGPLLVEKKLDGQVVAVIWDTE